MSWFACKACEAKDAELVRVIAEKNEAVKRLVDLADSIARATAGVPAWVPPSTEPLVTPLPEEIEIFLDAKFVHGTPLWRQQKREALKLYADAMPPEEIMETLAAGQTVSF